MNIPIETADEKEKIMADDNRNGGGGKRFGSGSGGGKRPYSGDRPRREGGSEGGERKSWGEKKPWGDKPRREGGAEGGERKPYGDRPAREGGERKTWGERKPWGDKKPYSGDRPRREEGSSEGGERKSYGDRPNREGGEKKSWGIRKPWGEKKPYSGDRPNRDGGSEGGERKPYGDRPRREGSEGGERKTWGEKKPWGDRPRRDDGERKPYGDRPRREGSSEGGERKPYGDRPRREEGGERKTWGEKKPWGDKPRRDDGGERKPYGDRPRREEGGERKSYGDRPKREEHMFNDGKDEKRAEFRERKPYYEKPRGYDKNRDYSKFRGKEKPENDMRRDRNEVNLEYFIHGKHPVLMALKNPARIIKRIVCSDAGMRFLEENLEREQILTYIIEVTTPDKIDSLIHARGDTNHQGIVAEVYPLPAVLPEALYGAKLIVATDKITDPQNIGAIIRSCAAFGVSALITQEKNSPPENATIAKTSAGCIELVPYVRVSSLWITLETLKEQGFQVIGLSGTATKSFGDIDTKKPTVLVIGSEGKGIGEAVNKVCDDAIRINISESVESLNASVAAALCFYEFSKN